MFEPLQEALANLSLGDLVALLGVFAASLPQLTASSRLHRRVAFWTTQMQALDPGHERKVADSLRRDGSARLIALDAYPGWRTAAAIYTVAVGVFVSVETGRQTELTGPLPDLIALLATLLLAPSGFIGVGFWFIMSQLRGRRITADQYLHRKIIRPGEHNAEQLPGVQFLGCFVAGLGISLAIIAIVTGYRDPDDYMWGQRLVLVAMIILAAGGWALAPLLRYKRLYKEYPRVLSEEPSTTEAGEEHQLPSVPAATEEQPHKDGETS